MRGAGHFVEGAWIFGAPLGGLEGPRQVVRGSGNGSVPEEGFLGPVYPGELHDVARTHSDRAGFSGVTATSLTVRVALVGELFRDDVFAHAWMNWLHV